MNFGDARVGMERAAREVPDADLEARVQAVELAARATTASWPKDTGESAKGWAATGTALVNDVRHTPFVHDRLVDRLVPQVFAAVAPEYATLVEARIDSAAGW